MAVSSNNLKVEARTPLLGGGGASVGFSFGRGKGNSVGRDAILPVADWQDLSVRCPGGFETRVSLW
jgi:hypothetical protein